jgi:hypothetical protein
MDKELIESWKELTFKISEAASFAEMIEGSIYADFIYDALIVLANKSEFMAEILEDESDAISEGEESTH